MSLSLENDVDDDRCGDEGGEGGDGQGETQAVGCQGNDAVAQEQQIGAKQGAGRDSQAVVGGVHNASGEVGHSHADERDGSAPGRDAAGKQRGGQNNAQTRVGDIDTQRARVVLAQQKAVKRFEQKNDRQRTHKQDNRHDRQFAPADRCQRPESPDDKQLERVGVGDILHDINQRTGYGADHHSDDEQADIVLDLSRHTHDQQQHECRTDDSRRGDSARAGSDHTEQRGAHDHERHAQTGPRADTQDIRSGKRVAEQGLHEYAADTQRAACQNGSQGFRQADIDENVVVDAAGAAGVLPQGA